MPALDPWRVMFCPSRVMASMRPVHSIRSMVSGPTRPPASIEAPFSNPDSSARGLLVTTMTTGSRRLRAARIFSAVVAGWVGLLSSSSWQRVVRARARRCPASGRLFPGGDDLFAAAVESLAAYLRFHSAESSVDSDVGSVEGRLETRCVGCRRLVSRRLGSSAGVCWRIRLISSRPSLRVAAMSSGEAPASLRRVSSSTLT